MVKHRSAAQRAWQTKFGRAAKMCKGRSKRARASCMSAALGGRSRRRR